MRKFWLIGITGMMLLLGVSTSLGRAASPVAVGHPASPMVAFMMVANHNISSVNSYSQMTPAPYSTPADVWSQKLSQALLTERLIEQSA